MDKNSSVMRYFSHCKAAGH